MRHSEEAPSPGFGACLGDVASFGLAVVDDPLRAVESYVTLCGVVSEVRALAVRRALVLRHGRPDVGVLAAAL